MVRKHVDQLVLRLRSYDNTKKSVCLSWVFSYYANVIFEYALRKPYNDSGGSQDFHTYFHTDFHDALRNIGEISNVTKELKIDGCYCLIFDAIT